MRLVTLHALANAAVPVAFFVALAGAVLLFADTFVPAEALHTLWQQP